jgi:preprotein translocase subunit SecB
MIMADAPEPNGKPPEGNAEIQSVNARVVAQYIKDLSFENPNIAKLLEGPGESPNLEINVDVKSQQMGPKLYESAIEFKARAVSKAGTIYDLECVYAGLLQIESMPQQMLEPFLLVNCPALIFPYLRRLVADLTREGGFPPLTLDPIDFGSLFMRRQQELAANASKS